MSFDDGFMLGMLLGGGTKGGDYNGNLRAVIDDGASNITIVVGEVPDDEEDEQYTDYNYAYIAEDFSDSVTTQSTTTDDEGTETVTTSSETFTKRIVKELYNASGALIMRADVASDGSINGYYDGDDLPIYLTEWRT